MKTIIVITTVLVISFLLGAETKVTFKPFMVKFDNIANGVGWLMMIIGINVVLMAARLKADKQGYKRGVDSVISEIKKQQEQ